MFSVTVFLGDTIAPIVLLYKNEDTLKVSLDQLEQVDSMVMGGTNASITRRLTIADDFGQRLELRRQHIGMLVQDMKIAREADIERGIFNMVTQAKANDRAKADPTLQAHFRSMQQGPAVLSPMGGPMNGFGRG